MASASNDALIERLGRLDDILLGSGWRDPSTRHGADPHDSSRLVARERARIWQEFSVRRRANRLRMSPNRIRQRAMAVTLAHLRGTA